MAPRRFYPLTVCASSVLPRIKHPLLSFVVEGIHPHDLGTLVDQEGVAIRTGHHCTQPVMQRFGVPATARASLAFYNTKEEIDILVKAIKRARRFSKIGKFICVKNCISRQF